MENHYEKTSTDVAKQKKKIRLLHSAPCGPRRKQDRAVKIQSARTRNEEENKLHYRTSSHVNMPGQLNISPRNAWIPRLHTSTNNTALSIVNKSGSTTVTFKDSAGLSRSLTWNEKNCSDCKNLHQLRELYQQRNRSKHLSKSEKLKSKDSNFSLNVIEDKVTVPGVALQKFRTAGIVVKTVVRWFNAIIENSYKKTPRTAAEHQYYTLYTSLEAQHLAFNKNLFVREQAFARVPKWAIDILGTEPQARTDTDCRRIHALLRGLKSFDKFTEQIQLSMCRSFSYQRVRSGRVILRRGHVGFNYYFIYSGSVFVNIEDVNIDGNKFDRTVSVLVRGDAFGELALLQNIRRTASITVREQCELLYVDKETFARVCPQIFEKEMEEKEHFLMNLRVFRNEFWTREMLKNLCADSQIQQFKTNKVVCVDSEEEEWIYICMSGKCSVIRRLELDKTHVQKRKKRNSTPMLSDEIINIITSLNKVDDENEEDEEEESSDEEATKERMLESMALDYRRDGRRRKLEEKADDTSEVDKKKLLSLSGPTTLTSLMTQDKRSKEGKDYVYVHIGELMANEIFNFYAILYPSRAPPHSSVILVSTGAQLMRIRKKVFFKTATKDALSIAGNIARLERFVTDEQLLEAYKEMASWDEFKYQAVQRAVGPNKENLKNKLSDQQVQIVYERRNRSHKLLKTLQKNHLIAKRIEEKEEMEEKQKRNQILENLRQKQKVLVDHKLVKIVRKDRNDMVIGRRRNVSSSVTSDQVVKPVLQEIKEKSDSPVDSFRPKRRMSRRYSQTTGLGALLPKPSEKSIPKNLSLDYKR